MLALDPKSPQVMARIMGAFRSGAPSMNPHASLPRASEAVDASPFARCAAASVGDQPAAPPAPTTIDAAAALFRGVCIAVGRAVRFWLDYHRALCELEGLTDEDLRDLTFRRADFHRLAWEETKRRYRMKRIER